MEQGRLEPLETHVKKNKRGLGAEKIKKKKEELPVDPPSEVDSEDVSFCNYLCLLLMFNVPAIECFNVPAIECGCLSST